MTADIKEKKPKTKQQQIRKFFFTLWNKDFNFADLWDDYSDIIRFLHGQLELCPDTNKLHWQGVIHMYDQCKFSKIHRLLAMKKGKNCDGWVKQQYHQGAEKYVHKDYTSQGQRFSYGQPSKQGERTDMRQILKKIREGSTRWELENEFPGQYARYSKFFNQYRGDYQKEKSYEYIPQEVILITGPTGLGKTKRVLYDINNKRKKNVYKIKCSGGLKWWADYNGEDTILLDEFNNQVPLCEMLDLLEGHQRRVEYKGGHTYLTSNTTYISSNLRLEQMYPNAKIEHILALRKRITKVISLWPDKNVVEVTEGNRRELQPQKRDDTQQLNSLSKDSFLVQRNAICDITKNFVTELYGNNRSSDNFSPKDGCIQPSGVE